MKQLYIILLISLFVQCSYAQTRLMRVILNDGNIQTFDIDSIRDMEFNIIPDTNLYSNVNIITFQGGQRAYRIIRDIDKISFNVDTLFNWIDSQVRDIYTINQNKYSLYIIDSITFDSYAFDTNITRLTNGGFDYWDCEAGIPDKGVNRCAIWIGNRLYHSTPYGVYTLDTSYHVQNDTTFCPINYSSLSFDANADGTKFLSVASLYPDVSIGRLYEYDRILGSSTSVIGDADTNISSAKFCGPDSIIYFSYGEDFTVSNRQPSDQGYYIYNRRTGTKTFILPFISALGPSEMVNGFDLTPDRKKIIIPVVQDNTTPFLIEYNFTTGDKDTLIVPFDTLYSHQWGLWLRYNHDGSKILYSRYPAFSFGPGPDPGYHASEVGIIDRATLRAKILQTNPTNEGIWISVFPNWSPDEKAIVYCATTIVDEPAGYIGGYEICICKIVH